MLADDYIDGDDKNAYRAGLRPVGMETTDAFRGLTCFDCGERFDAAATGRCPDCGGILDPTYDYDDVPLSTGGPVGSMWDYEAVLPFPAETANRMDAGGTPLVACPDLADRIGVDRVFLKDEGRNPTGTFKDRGAAVSVAAAAAAGADDVALSSAGNAGHAAAAYANAAGLDAHVFLPKRAGFTRKAMVEVHGGDLRVAGGEEAQIGDAGRAYERAMADHDDWQSVKTFVTPYRHDGKKTMAYEIIDQLDGEPPDGVVYPTGGGVGLVGMHKAATELRAMGHIEELPGTYAAQSSGCAPVVDAHEAGADRHEPWTDIETVCGGIAIPDPGASDLVLEAIYESDGGAVATDDEAILDAAVDVARHTGLEMAPACAAAASGAFALADRGAFGPDDTVVLLNTGAGSKDADALRAHVGERNAG